MHPHKLTRVLLVFSSSELGGAERSLTRMAVAADGEVEFALATLDGPGPWVDWCREQGRQPFVIGKRRRASRHGRFGVLAIVRLAALVRRQRYAALYVIGLRASIWLRLMRPWLSNVRIVQGVRWNPDSNSRLDRAFRLVEWGFGRFIDCYICNSKAAAATLAQKIGISEKKIRVIYNGLNDVPPIPARMNHPPTHVVVLANISERKGHFQFLDVVSNVLRHMPDVRFFFVGRDDMKGRLILEIERRGLASAITLTGYQPDVGRWLQDASVMVLPSLWGEGCPTSILEGQAYGLPVIAYAIDGVPELILDGIDGLLAVPGNTIALTSALLRVLAEPTLAARMGGAGRAKVAREFTLARCASLHSDVFLEVAS